MLSPVKTDLLDDLAASSSRKFREKWGLGANLYLPVPSGDLRQKLVPQRERGLLHLSHVSRCVRLSCPIIVCQKSCQVKQIEVPWQHTKYKKPTKHRTYNHCGETLSGGEGVDLRCAYSFRSGRACSAASEGRWQQPCRMAARWDGGTLQQGCK